MVWTRVLIWLHRCLLLARAQRCQLKKWPAQRFALLGGRIRSEFPDLQLVVLGGAEDAAIGQELCNAWGEKAYNLAGKLSIYGSAAVLERCVGYVGNDTGDNAFGSNVCRALRCDI